MMPFVTITQRTSNIWEIYDPKAFDGILNKKIPFTYHDNRLAQGYLRKAEVSEDGRSVDLTFEFDAEPEPKVTPKRFITNVILVDVIGPVDLMADWYIIEDTIKWCDGRRTRSEEKMGHPPHDFTVPTDRGPVSVRTGDYIIKNPGSITEDFYVMPTRLFKTLFYEYEDD